MANVVFKSFQEASAFSKSLSMAIKASTTIIRDGDTWWVDDPRTGHDTNQRDYFPCLRKITPACYSGGKQKAEQTQLRTDGIYCCR